MHHAVDQRRLADARRAPDEHRAHGGDVEQELAELGGGQGVEALHVMF